MSNYLDELLTDEHECKNIAKCIAENAVSKSCMPQAFQLTDTYLKAYDEAMDRLHNIKNGKVRL